MAALVTFETVAAAAEALQTAGQRTSVRAVMAALGGGSPNTVLKLLADWKAGRPVVRMKDTELDTGITDAIKKQMQRVAEAAAATAEEKAAELDENLQTLSASYAAAEQQIATLTADIDKAKDQADDLATQINTERVDAKRAIQAAAKTETALRLDLVTERQKLETTAAALVRAEVRLEALPKMESEAEKMEAEIKKLQDELNAIHQAKQQAEQITAVTNATLNAANQRIQDLLERLPKMEAEMKKLQDELNAIQQDKQQAEQATAVANANLNAANQRSQDLLERLNKAEAGNIKMQERIDASSKELSSLNEIVQAGRSEITDLKKSLNEVDQKVRSTKGKPGPKSKQAPEAPESNNDNDDNGTNSQTMPLAM